MIRIEQTGPLTLIQDLGRPGLAHLGVSASGAADRGALRLANRLVGNAEDAAASRGHPGRPGRSAPTDCSGVPSPAGRTQLRVLDGRRRHAPGDLAAESGPAAGRDAAPHAPPTGLRNYLAVRGGLLAEPTLGSCSTDLLSGLGPDVVRAGDTFTLGAPSGDLPDVASVPPAEPVSGALAHAGARGGTG